MQLSRADLPETLILSTRTLLYIHLTRFPDSLLYHRRPIGDFLMILEGEYRLPKSTTRSYTRYQHMAKLETARHSCIDIKKVRQTRGLQATQKLPPINRSTGVRRMMTSICKDACHTKTSRLGPAYFLGIGECCNAGPGVVS